jgi:hypothetical protein
MTAEMKTKCRPFLSNLEPVRSEVEAWRRSRKKGERIPEQLWQAMGELARAFGVGRVSRVLGVGYHALKERARGPAHAAESRNNSAVFVELPMPGAVPRSDCVVELEDGRGAKMTLRLGSDSGTQMLSIVQAFWGRER